jgi:hypothetical protein
VRQAIGDLALSAQSLFDQAPDRFQPETSIPSQSSNPSQPPMNADERR